MNINFKDGKIIYDDLTKLNLALPKNKLNLILDEDMLQVEYGKYLLDLGYYELDTGNSFVIFIIKNLDWENPIYRKETDIKNLKLEIELAIEKILSLQKNSY